MPQIAEYTVVTKAHPDSEEIDVAPYFIFAPVLRFQEDTITLNEAVETLREATNAIAADASGFTEGTFYFNTHADAVKASKIVNKYIHEMYNRVDYKLKGTDLALLNSFHCGKLIDRLKPTEERTMARLLKMDIVVKTEDGGYELSRVGRIKYDNAAPDPRRTRNYLTR